MSDSLPLKFRPDRRYPVTLARTDEVHDEHAVCMHCVSGACCTTEGAIALTAFDVLRLSAFLDLAPGTFLETFTQDRFVDPAGQERYATWIAAEESSIVTFLRRRSPAAASPCMFLKYVRDADGTPRRICSVHAARPLACREYYYDTCKKRSTGETALALTDGYEAVRDGELTLADVESRIAALGPAQPADGLATLWQRAFWHEMRRALRLDEANEEGAYDPDLAARQDPVDAKLDRLLSSRHLRFEEKYGPTPHSEQLHSYQAGRTFRDAPDRVRLLRIVATAPAHGLYPVDADYPYHIGLRGLLPGARLPQRFGAIERAAWAQGPLADAIVRGWECLVGIASLAEWNDGLMELEPQGEAAMLLLDAVLRFPPARQRRLGIVLPPLLRRWLARTVAVALTERFEALAQRRSFPRAGWMDLWRRAQRFDRTDAPAEVARIVAAIRETAEQGGLSDFIGRLQRRSLRPGPPPVDLDRLIAEQAEDGAWSADPSLDQLPDWQDRHVLAIVAAGAAALEALQEGAIREL